MRTLTVAFQHAADSAAERGSLRAITDPYRRPAAAGDAYRHSGGHRRHLGWHRRVHALLNSIPEVVTSGLNIAGGMIVVVGYAMVINMMRAGYLMPFFYLGFVTAAFTNFNLVALGVIGVVMAVLYIQLSPKYNKSQVVRPARLMRTISITNSTRNR